MNTAAAQYRAVQRSAATDCVTQHADLVRRIAHHLAARLPAGLQVGSAGTLNYKGGKASCEPLKEIEPGRGLTR